MLISPQFDASLAISWGITKPIALIGNQEVQRRKEGLAEGTGANEDVRKRNGVLFGWPTKTVFLVIFILHY